ncbi:mitosis inhibitor protein kinase [Naviculisporaceae sp. PSN 640]
MSYSNGSGGTLTLPSPTHVHHVDVSSAVRTLRRSLSRSPSKFRLTGRSQSSDSFNFGQSTTPAPSARFDNFAIGSDPTEVARPSIFSTPQPQPTSSTSPFRPTVKLSVRSARAKTGTSRPLSRTRLSPKSPLKRVFGPSQDSGNPVPSTTPASENRGQENLNFGDFSLPLSPVSRRDIDKPARHSMHLDVTGSSKSLSKFLDFNDSFASTSVSPLKRSDATMSLDHSNPGSPVAKRRSLHGISDLGLGLESESNIFDVSPQLQPPQDQPQTFDVHEDANQEYELTGVPASPFQDPVASPTPGAPRRTTSLRKSTLQQRSSVGRRGGAHHLAQLSHEASPLGARARPRLSLDQYLPPEERASLFSQPQGLPHPSLHMMPRPANQQPHPLSRTLTQSSSNSSLPDDSPTHVPVHLTEKPRAPLNFARSMPLTSQRPTNDSDPVATPNYKRAKPLQSAFMSTGLVSKMTRNPDLATSKNSVMKIAAMPDTPCKKQYNSATFPPQLGSGRRPSRASFGSPSTPFGASTASNRGNLFASQDKPSSLFFQQVRSHGRKNSLLGLEDQDAAGESADDFPPTPTKNIFFKSTSTPSHQTQTPTASRTYVIPGSGFGFNQDQSISPIFKSQIQRHSDKDGENDDAGGLHPHTPGTRAPSPLGFAPPSFSRVDGQRTPSKLSSTTNTAPALFGANSGWSNKVSGIDRSASASPLSFHHAEMGTPRTPQDSMAPPDPSSLSISNSQDDTGDVSQTPATPTTQGRRLFSNFGARRFSITPQHGQNVKEIEDSLSYRFDSYESLGSGEFSQVYKVVQSSVPIFASTPGAHSSSFQGNEQVFAVKKIRIPSHGIKERETKLREVSILKALKGVDNVLQYINDWEERGHLYIQTEFCAEGSLKEFLETVGHGGRLDDFRIWKILLETAQGLAAIHDAGFIHLDLKPANIFINFNGSLKIGDFGMATTWPAPKGIEGEGDREYIGPEILRGQYDKPADIFSLGLIVLEIACNVFLPDNGPTWQALRSGDLSAVPTLTVGQEAVIRRDANGMPLDPTREDELRATLGITNSRFNSTTHDPSNLFSPLRKTELEAPPSFMADPKDPDSLDSVVQWMIQPNPCDRPTAQQLLCSEPVLWVMNRRLAGATVYEGNWGPVPFPVDDELVDTEMTDV